ncbi:hypothetical protein [Fundidesulfovibrio putealis]|uniref:hypothetical protein n=1 Tax=Fundidesulfovibrio putealis TaxID=270496 RepID=UPI00041CF1DA|nr:hypothetical protein [Fundidesulfovibrio putealis]
MSMSRGKGLLIALVIFLTGSIVGAFGLEAFRVLRGGPFKHLEGKGPVGFIMERMSSDLKLSEAQKKDIEPVITEMIGKIDQLRRPIQEQEEAIFEEYNARVRQLLTESQAAKQDEIVKRMRDFRKRMQQGPHGSSLPPPPPPDGLFFGSPGPPPVPGPGPGPQ